jgi:hypothetical protein
VNINTTSRSDQIRQRRSTRRATIPARQKRSTIPVRGAPPVFVRGNAPLDGIIGGRRKSRTRRRYDVALGIPGAEVRLPSLPQVRFGWRLISFFLVAFLCMALYVLWTSPLYQIQEIQITGLQRLTPHEINTLLNISGEHIFAIDQDQLLLDLKTTFPELSAVAIDVNLPAEVAVTVEEREPILVWYQNGRTMWVDETGYSFPAREANPPAITVNAAGAPAMNFGEDADPNQLLTPAFVEAILEVQAIAPNENSLVYSTDHGLGWKEKKGWTVYLGTDLSNITMKLQVYDAIFKHLKKSGIQPELVSVEMVHSPYYRLAP